MHERQQALDRSLAQFLSTEELRERRRMDLEAFRCILVDPTMRRTVGPAICAYYEEEVSMDIVAKLDLLGGLKPGDPFPDELGGTSNWGPAISRLANDAAAEIRRLRRLAGAVSQGERESFAEIKAKVHPGRGVHEGETY
jgi:hypothetical protein